MTILHTHTPTHPLLPDAHLAMANRFVSQGEPLQVACACTRMVVRACQGTVDPNLLSRCPLIAWYVATVRVGMAYWSGTFRAQREKPHARGILGAHTHNHCAIRSTTGNTHDLHMASAGIARGAWGTGEGPIGGARATTGLRKQHAQPCPTCTVQTANNGPPTNTLL